MLRTSTRSALTPSSHSFPLWTTNTWRTWATRSREEMRLNSEWRMKIFWWISCSPYVNVLTYLFVMFTAKSSWMPWSCLELDQLPLSSVISPLPPPTPFTWLVSSPLCQTTSETQLKICWRNLKALSSKQLYIFYTPNKLLQGGLWE